MNSNPRNKNPQPGNTQLGGTTRTNDRADDAVSNDSLGTVDPADSTGLDEDKETGDAKAGNRNTRED